LGTGGRGRGRGGAVAKTESSRKALAKAKMASLSSYKDDQQKRIRQVFKSGKKSEGMFAAFGNPTPFDIIPK
jgi:hypothetical protein